MKRTSVFYFGRRIMRIRIYGISDHACKHGYQRKLTCTVGVNLLPTPVVSMRFVGQLKPREGEVI